MRPSFPLRALPAALAVAFLLVGCGDGDEAAPPPPPAQTGSTPSRTEPAPAPPPAPPVERPTRAADDDPGEPISETQDVPADLQHPDGVPFPLPEPLPPECHPRAITDGPAPNPGPAPLTFWVGGTGTTDGLLQYPRAMVGEADGSVIVVDKTGRLQRWDHDGRLRASVRTPSIAQGKPTGLGTDASGQVLVADTHYCRVLVYGPDLALRRAYGAPGRAGGQFMFVSAVKEGPDGLHWTCDYGDEVARVQALKPDGAFVRSAGVFGTGEGEMRRPMSLTFDPAAREVFVADAVNHRIVVVGLDDARWLRTLGAPGRAPGQLDFPYDVVRDEEGRLWVAEFGNQRVSVLDPEDGACLGTWGEPGRRLGTLARPWGLALGREGRLWVLDSGNDRVYALDRAAVLAKSRIPASHEGR